MTKKEKEGLPLDRPTRATIEQLFRNLESCKSGKYWEDEEVKAVDSAIEQLEKKLENDSGLKELRQERVKIRSRVEKESKEWSKEVNKVRRTYLSGGITDDLISQLSRLVKIANEM